MKDQSHANADGSAVVAHPPASLRPIIHHNSPLPIADVLALLGYTGKYTFTTLEQPASPAPKPKTFSYAAAIGSGAKPPLINGIKPSVIPFSISHARKDSEDEVIPALRQPSKVLRKIIRTFKPSFDQTRMLKRQRFRGLINDGNMCYLNAILHPLVHCIPFQNLVHELIERLPEGVENVPPIVAGLQNLFEHFDMPGEKPDVVGASFSPRPIYEALQSATNFSGVKGAQEDAEEFLGYLLDGLHEEFVEAAKSAPAEEQPNVTPDSPWTVSAEHDTDDGWRQVGKFNKPVTTRRVDTEPSPVKSIFGGVMRSVVERTGQKQSATLEPFRTIQLDISSPDVTSLSSALHLMMQREHVDGSFFVKQLFFERLPPVLVFALKRYTFEREEGVRKLHKHVEYPVMLEMPGSFVANHDRRKGGVAATYRLFAVVHHHGQIAGSGHYSCDILRRCGRDVDRPRGSGRKGSVSPTSTSSAPRYVDHRWMHLDDTDVQPVPVSDVLSSSSTRADTYVPDWDMTSDRMAYLLFYESCEELQKVGYGEGEMAREAGCEGDGFERARAGKGRRRH